MKTKLILFAGFFLFLILAACEKSTTESGTTAISPIDTAATIISHIADPQECASCHPNHFDEWQTSMHAYAMTDPIFFALNNIGQQRSSNQLDQFCVKCHSPASQFLNETSPGFNPDDLSSLTKSAINCDACHLMNTREIKRGKSIQSFHLDRIRRGSMENPQENTFHESAFDNNFNFSEVCAPCHDLKSPDFSINLEETNKEWDESPYSAMGVECQDCHMTAYTGKAAIQSMRDKELHRHYFTGVDYPLTEFPGKNETIQRVDNLLKNAVSMTVSAPTNAVINSELSVEVRIKNDQTGHDIPSGSIFERQMWIEFIAKDTQTDSLVFSSGLLDENFDLMDHHSELVANNTVAADTFLTLFNGIPKDENGNELLFFWEAKSVQKNTIKAFSSHFSNYVFQAPAASTTLELSVRLLFRTFPPYLFRAINKSELISELVIFEMESFNQTINITL